MMKLSRRELTLVLTTALIMCIPIAIIANSQQNTELPSSVYEWNAMTVTKNANGEKRQIFDSPTRNLDKLECHITTLDVGKAPHAPHQHKDEELLIIKEGTVEALVNGKLQQAGPGSIIFQAADVMHGLKNIGKTQATYYVLRFSSPKAGK